MNNQIEVNTTEAIQRARLQAARQAAAGAGAEFCVECDEPIPKARREAIPGVQLCVDCRSGQDKAFRPVAGINRRGSKDSQLK